MKAATSLRARAFRKARSFDLHRLLRQQLVAISVVVRGLKRTAYTRRFEFFRSMSLGDARRKMRARVACILPTIRLLDRWSDHLKLAVGMEGVSELRQIANLATSAGYGSNESTRRRCSRPRILYRSGLEVELTFETVGEDGKPRCASARSAGGGRYDGLVGRFRGDNIPATGILHRRVAPDGGAAAL